MVALAFILALASMTQSGQAQTFQVIHNFTGGQDGAYPSTGLTIDDAGNMYGTAFGGGAPGFGTIFTLDNDGGGWSVTPIYSFHEGRDGAGPIASVSIGPDGVLYGSTSAGGGGPCISVNGYRGCGTVYSLRPPPRAPATVLYNWGSTILYRFSSSDGAYPQGDLTSDSSGNIYGTTINGGSAGWGLIYSLVHSGGEWNQNILYQAQGGHDGAYPWGGVVFDHSGNLFGVFSEGGPYLFGAVYELSPSGSGYTESTVHGFTFTGSDGSTPQGGLIWDGSGNLYGSTVHDSNGGGTVFELVASGGSYSYNFLYGLSGGIGLGPYDKLTMDAAGNLYGTTFGDGRYGFGSVFKLTRSGSGWTYSTMHDFTGGSDGGNPICRPVFDSSGNLYGTAFGGGANHQGVIFQITP
jgi:uncharacterized repeat protein (TIGR03803 family)